MNTHDIETVLRSFLTGDGYIAADDIPVICATIEADRKRRGEPVGYIMPTAIKQLKAGGNAIVGGVSQGCDVPIYTAPQPAEPVKVDAKASVLSDDALDDALSNLEHDNYEQSYSGYKNRQADIALIRTALARYK